MSEIIAALRQVTKAYPGTLAAKGVSVEFLGGELHALVGENGAGKSTLVKILAGSIQPDSGFVEVNGNKRKLPNPRAALSAGIGVVHQAGSLIDTLTVRENLQLSKLMTRRKSHDGKRPTPPLTLPGEMSLNTFVRDLNPRQRQLLEIHRVLLQRARLLVLDESTSNLSPQESNLLFADLSLLAKSGYAVVVVSHKLPELLEHCHRFTVLRKGRVVASLNRAQATLESMINLLSDVSASSQTGPLTTVEGVEPAEPERTVVVPTLLRFKTVSTDHRSPSVSIHDLNLEVRRGEILGLAGRPGSGISTVLKLMRGAPVRLAAGSVEWSKDFENGSNKKIGFVPGDRTNRGVITEFTTGENLLLRRRNLIGRLCSHSRREQRRAFLSSIIKEFDVRPPDPDRKLATLSGGNMQKVLIAREMEYAGALLIVESPTAGLDIRSARFVRRMLRRKVRNGGTIVLASDDLDELSLLSDRVVVFCGGRSTSELKRGEITTAALGLALAGSTERSQFVANKTAGRKLTV